MVPGGLITSSDVTLHTITWRLKLGSSGDWHTSYLRGLPQAYCQARPVLSPIGWPQMEPVTKQRGEGRSPKSIIHYQVWPGSILAPRGASVLLETIPFPTATALWAGEPSSVSQSKLGSCDAGHHSGYRVMLQSFPEPVKGHLIQGRSFCFHLGWQHCRMLRARCSHHIPCAVLVPSSHL